MGFEILRGPPTVVCPQCAQFHNVLELRRCGSCGWVGHALPTPPEELPLVVARTRDLVDATWARIARWRFLAVEAGLDYVTAKDAGACGVCKETQRSPASLVLVVTLGPPIGDQRPHELAICGPCVLRIAHDLVGGGL